MMNIGRLTKIGRLIIPLLVLFSAAYPQIEPGMKVEVEKRIGAASFPEQGLAFISGFQNKSRLRLYRQTTADELLFEAKFKHQGQRYSIEFDTLGVLKDIELEVAKSALDEETRSNLIKDLRDRFSSYKIKKIQRKWVPEMPLDGLNPSLHQYFNDTLLKDPLAGFQMEYEIEVSGRRKGEGRDLFELIYNRAGHFVAWRRIELPGMENILF